MRNADGNGGKERRGEERRAATKPPTVDIEPKGQVVVRLEDSLRIMCTMGSPLQICRVEIQGESSTILSLNQTAEDGIKYYGEGTHKGQCGVHIFKVKEKHNGIFKCALTPVDGRTESYASVDIVIAKPPNNPELQTSQGHYGRNEYQKGEKLEISCSASGGRPPANISLYLDDELLGNDERPSTYDDLKTNEGSVAIQNASRSLDWTDNSKTLRCVTSHVALDQPKERKMQLHVYYPPQPQLIIERFGYVIGRQGTVNVTVHANPKPRFLWRVNGEKIEEGRPDESNRLETSTAVDLGNGSWLVVLTIDSVQKSDTEKEYILEAHNIEGAYEYHIVLSTSPEPAGAFSHFYGKLSEHMHALAEKVTDYVELVKQRFSVESNLNSVDLDAGSIIGIVVGALVLILIVFLVIFARATGRWCFAGSSTTRNLGESDLLADPGAAVTLLHIGNSETTNNANKRQSSDTESAGRYSRTEVDTASSGRGRKPKLSIIQLFRRNKDKVSGADTDTMRTVVTVDDEKLQPCEQQQQQQSSPQDSRINPSSVEGGIVYAELDLTQQQQGGTPRRLNEDKTEYAEILYTKPETTDEETPDK
ncbi:PREDICTED: fasciclin-3 isoform X2 [Polistes canadensis]|uniref:fasciclin-3 isoform X2 n=1 Tax=Polistes canadensis TaxID=91411 RepID=UPI000718F97E|nr:PREDICTED: fasciclin-3 isoform X2 [Polistes canadensis]